MKSRPLLLVLLLLLALLQYPLWFGKGGMLRVHELRRLLAEQRAVNDSLRIRNQQMEGDVRSLSEGMEAIEERARNDFGMVKQGELLIQLVKPSAANQSGVIATPLSNQSANNTTKKADAD